MRAFITVTLIMLGFVAVVLIGSVVMNVGERYDPVSDARQSAQLERISRQAEIEAALQPVDVALAFAWRVLPLLVVVGGLTYTAVLGGAALQRFFRERRPDPNGLLPVAVAELPSAGTTALTSYHQARIAEAERAIVPTVPASLSYHAPHYRGEYRGDAVPALAQSVTRIAPTFASLLSAGRIGPGSPILLGHDLDTDEGVWGDWKDLYSAGLGGKQGSGKSWTAASLIAQSLLGGGRVILCDPHAGDSESLATRLEPLAPHIDLIADDEHQILEAARYAHDEFLRRRDAAKRKQPYNRTPVVLAIDEWTSLLRGKLGDELPPILASLTTEGRKYGVNALLLAQRWEAAAAGGGDVRNTLTAHYVHRMRSDEARMMTGLRASALPDDTLALHPGQAYLFDTQGNIRKIATPQMTPSDLTNVALMLAGERAGAPASPLRAGRPLGFVAPTVTRIDEGATEGAHEGAETVPLRAHQNAEPLTPEEARIIAGFLDGKTVSDLAAELTGGKKSGDAYKQASVRVATALRKALATGAIAAARQGGAA